MLEKVEISPGAIVTECVHSDDFFFQRLEAFFAGFAGEGGPLVVLPLAFLVGVGFELIVDAAVPLVGFGVSQIEVFAPGVGAGEVIHGGSTFDFVCDFGHGFEVVFVAVVEGIGEEVVEAVLVILFDEKVAFVVVLEFGDIEDAFLDLLLDLVTVELHDRLRRTQEGLVVVDLVQQQL